VTSLNDWLWAAVALLLLVGGALERRARMRLVAENRDLVNQISSAAETLERADEALETSRKSLEQAVEDRELALEQATFHREKADRQFHCIEDLEKQRDGVWAMYRDSTLGAGNAQDLLFRELTRYGAYLNAQAAKFGFKPIEPSPDLLKVLAMFRETHVDEAGAQRGCEAETAKLVERGARGRPPTPEPGQPGA